jgi:transcription elongation factor Elf1
MLFPDYIGPDSVKRDCPHCESDIRIPWSQIETAGRTGTVYAHCPICGMFLEFELFETARLVDVIQGDFSWSLCRDITPGTD